MSDFQEFYRENPDLTMGEVEEKLGKIQGFVTFKNIPKTCCSVTDTDPSCRIKEQTAQEILEECK